MEDASAPSGMVNDRGRVITGAGQTLKRRKPGLRVIAVQRASSPVLSGAAPGPHGIQGIGAGIVPEVLELEVIDEIFTVQDDEAVDMARRPAR